MKRLMRLIAFGVFTFLSSWSYAEDSSWELEASDEDRQIQVFTREVEGSELKEFKGVTLIKTDVNALVALLKDADAATQWMHNIIEFDVKEEINEVESVVYSISETPWPVTDRDSYVRSVLTADANGTVKSTFKAEPEFGPLDEEYVRMPSVEGGWTFTPKEAGTVEVTYQVHADPGGSLPNWLVNSIVVETPLETLTNLHEQLKQDKYQNQRFAFIEKAKQAQVVSQ